jgi:hypothetical protein
MNCDLAHDLLQKRLDGTPIESPEWLAHLRQCADCRSLTAAGRRLQDGLHRLTAPLPPPGLAERIAERVLLDRRRARRGARRRLAVSLALAASFILALTLRLDWRVSPSRSEVRPPEAIVKNIPSGIPEGTGVSRVLTNDREIAGTTQKRSPTLSESAAEVGEVFAVLRNQTADETLGQTRRWVSSVPSPTLPKVDLTAMGSPPRPLLEASEGVSQGLQPVTNSARRAVDLFLRELPMETMETN